MTRQSLISRRRMLTAVGVGATVALAGCSGNGQDGSGKGENGPENSQTETESTAEDTGSEATEGQDTETPTETEPQFSTEGDDSDLIESPKSELLLTVDDLPGSGWSEVSGSGDITFERETDQGNTETLFISLDKSDNVSDAEAQLENIDLYSLRMGTGEAEKTRSLDIGVESVWYTGTGETGQGENISADMIKLRDANVSAFVVWIVLGTDDSDVVSLQDIGDLTVALHRKWQ